MKEFHMEYQGRLYHVEFKEGESTLVLLQEVLRRLINTSLKALEE